MRTFKQVVRELITGLRDGSIVVGKRQPESPKPPINPPDPDKVIESMMNAAADKPKPGDLKIEFANPMAKEVLQSMQAGEEHADHFSYIKAMPHKHGISFQWGRKGFGFGECDLYYEDGRWKCDAEKLGKHFLHDLLAEFSQTVEVDE